MLTDLQGEVLAQVSLNVEPVPDRQRIIADIVRLVERVLVLQGVPIAQLVALGVGLQGTVGASTGIVLDWANRPVWAPAWKGLDIASELRGRLGTRVIVVQDSFRAMGVTAYRLGLARGKADFLYVYLGEGAGCGLILRGRPYTSSSGLASEIGHVCVDEDGPCCACGNRGCLELFSSTPAVLSRMQQRLEESGVRSPLGMEDHILSADGILKAARAGDKLAYQVLDEAGTQVGKVIATLLNVLGCDLVVLGGPLTCDGGVVLQAVQRQVRWRALEHVLRRARIVYDDQGEFAGARGSAFLALVSLFESLENLQWLVENTAQAPAANRLTCLELSEPSNDAGSQASSPPCCVLGVTTGDGNDDE